MNSKTVRKFFYVHINEYLFKHYVPSVYLHDKCKSVHFTAHLTGDQSKMPNMTNFYLSSPYIHSVQGANAEIVDAK